MEIFELDIDYFVDHILRLVESYVFEEGTMSPNFSIENKEACKNIVKLQIDQIFESYDIIQIKNKFTRIKKEEKKDSIH